MPTQNKRRGNKSQASNSQNISREYSASVKEYERYKREAAKAREKAAKARDKELSALLKKSSDLGIYSPKSTELTRYRRSRLNQVKREYGEYLNNQKYFFIPVGKQERKTVTPRAQSLEVVTTKTGIFYPKEGHKSASLKIDKRRQEFFIERRGKTKAGVNKGRLYRDVTPLTSIDQIDRERDRLTRMAKRLGPLGPNERLVFKVVENGTEGYSHGTFSNMNLMLGYLDKYPKSTAARVNFFRHIKVEKSTVKEWNALHPPRSPGAKERTKIERGKYNTRRSK